MVFAYVLNFLLKIMLDEGVSKLIIQSYWKLRKREGYGVKLLLEFSSLLHISSIREWGISSSNKYVWKFGASCFV